MIVGHSFDLRFVTLIDKLRKTYSEKMFDLEGIGEKDLDINAYSKKFFSSEGNTADKSIDANANVSDSSVVSWENESTKPIKKLNALYVLWKTALDKYGVKRANKIVEHEIKGSIRLHDAFLILRPYCYSTSLGPLVEKGMPFYDKIKIGPIKHFMSYINVSLQYLCYMSNQIAGACAFPDFFIYADYFIRKDFGEDWFNNPTYVDLVKQHFQSWIFSVNFSWRSNQSPFTNLSIFDRNWLEAIFGEHVNPDFNKPNFDNVTRIQKIFIEEYIRNHENNPFTFPVMTAAYLVDEKGDPKDEDFFNFVCEMNTKNGMFNFFADTVTSSLASCCRLRSDISDTKRTDYTNSFGVGGVNIGSHRVVTLNLPQIAYISEDWEHFLKLLESRTALIQDVLDTHRDIMKKLIKDGRLPLYTYGFMFLERQFSTIGFIGMNEALEIMGFDILDENGDKKAKEILELFNSMNVKRTKVDGHLRNVEQVPGESAAYNFARKDHILFENAKYDLYSNQYIPLTKETDIVHRIITQGRYDRNVGGGSILHLNVNEFLTLDQMKKLVRFTASKGVMYFAVNYAFSQCQSCGKVYVGKLEKSPCHNATVVKYIRVVGYLTPVATWAKERRYEFEHRQFYTSLKDDDFLEKPINKKKKIEIKKVDDDELDLSSEVTAID